ncbi:hypothetical protein B0H13DRAFT_1853549 [Mycena leptocephala]|nr:hypothetical protein B0H13DRAFT_1853549 [Mycena leptocephala]
MICVNGNYPFSSSESNSVQPWLNQLTQISHPTERKEQSTGDVIHFIHRERQKCQQSGPMSGNDNNSNSKHMCMLCKIYGEPRIISNPPDMLVDDSVILRSENGFCQRKNLSKAVHRDFDGLLDSDCTCLYNRNKRQSRRADKLCLNSGKFFVIGASGTYVLLVFREAEEYMGLVCFVPHPFPHTTFRKLNTGGLSVPCPQFALEDSLGLVIGIDNDGTMRVASYL